MPSTRPARFAGLVICAALTLTACSSSGAGHSSAAPEPSPSSTIASSPAPTARSSPVATGPTPITLPSRSPAPVVSRKLTRPAGLQPIDGSLCDDTVVSTADVANLANAMTDYTEVDEQVNQVGYVAGVFTVTLPAARKARTAFLQAGYAASFPVVQDVTELAAVEAGVITAWRTRNLTPVPALYLRLVTASKQYLADTQATYSSGRDVCTD